MSLREIKELNCRFYEELLNTGDISLVEQFFASHVAEVQQMISRLHRAFASLHFTIEDQIGEGDKLVTRWTVTGIHVGEWEGFIPTHRFVKWTGTSTQKYSDEKIVEYFTEENHLALHQQLEVLP